MNPSVGTVMHILGLNTWLFGNAVKDVESGKSAFRANDNTNEFDRIAGHVTCARHGITKLLGIETPDLGWGDFESVEGPGAQFSAELECPSLEDIGTKFNQVTEALMAKLPEVSDETLATASPIPIPGDDPTIGDLFTFLTMHETYHIGQLGLLKKGMGGKRIMDG